MELLQTIEAVRQDQAGVREMFGDAGARLRGTAIQERADYQARLGAAASLIAIVQLAAHAYLIDKGQSDPLWPRIGRRVLDELGMSDDELADYFDDLLARFHGTPL